MKTAKRELSTEKEKGRVFTPDYIVSGILDLSGYRKDRILKRHCIDNSCGDGAFLCEIVRRYCKAALDDSFTPEEIRSDLSVFIHGIEIDPEECRKCIANLSRVAREYGVIDVNWDIVCGNTLSVRRFDGKMDYVIGNPPYVRVHNLGESFDDIKNFSFARGGMTDLFIAFFEISLKMLNQTGTIGYITPSSYFNSLAGSYMRTVLCRENLLDKVVDLKHFQAFSSTTYTAITVLKKNRTERDVAYFQFDEKSLLPYFVCSLSAENYDISGNYYFAEKSELDLLKKIFGNLGRSDIQVKNGYATLCDSVFVHDFDFDSDMIIPVIKASKGIKQKILFPYDEKAKLLSEDTVRKDEKIFRYLTENKEKLLNRSMEKDGEKYWYAFGRSQALLDTFKDKIAINTLIRDEKDLKFVEAPAGTGVYGGLYIVSETIPMAQIIHALKSQEFVTYIRLLGKYKSGGYYTYSSKDVKAYLDYKFAYDGGLYEC